MVIEAGSSAIKLLEPMEEEIKIIENTAGVNVPQVSCFRIFISIYYISIYIDIFIYIFVYFLLETGRFFRQFCFRIYVYLYIFFLV